MNARFAPTPASANAWQANLNLVFEQRGERTVLSHNQHEGPLRVQKALYPEGPAVCQAIVLHPPSGIAGGDALQIRVSLKEGAQAQLTTPGAGKWYRSAGPEASQQIQLEVGAGATLEWLPQENIVFDGAKARMATQIKLAEDSRFLGWDILCLGRTESGERFTQGYFEAFCRVDRQQSPIWLERGSFDGNDPMLASPAGWAGHTVCGSLVCSFPDWAQQSATLLPLLRAHTPDDNALNGITALPGLLIARYLGDQAEACRHWFTTLWQILRPACCARPAVTPRIWHT